MIIGICGTFASGKDSVAEYLAAKGFSHVSTGDEWRRYIEEHNLGGLDRDNLRQVANRIRAEKGSDYIVRKALADHPERPMVLSGLRTSGEVEALKALGGHLIAVDAPVERRYTWAKARGRIDDAVTTAEFKQQEEAEIVNTDPNHQQITNVIAMADFNISNEGTLEELYRKVDDILERFGNDKGQSPNGK